MNDDVYYYLFFSYFVGIGPTRFDRLLNHFGTIKKMYEASKADLKSILPHTLVEGLITFRHEFDPEKEYKELRRKNIHVIARQDKKYPGQFLQMTDPPICLFIKGNMGSYDYERDIFFAIVGTRDLTEYGEYVTRKFGHELAQMGFVIVSGMARGIDACAHWSALEAGGRTIAFMGCGVNTIYPPSNAHLYGTILKKGGLIISEAPPDMFVQKGLFVSRNRLIAGLSRGVLVAEGLKDSGSLITARCALDMGKEVFAPPAPINSNQSEAPNMLLKEGAKLVTKVEDILEEFNLSLKMKPKKDILETLSEDEKIIYSFLLKHPENSDEMARALGWPIYKILMSISTLEIKQIIEKSASGKYQISV